jgi:hypothetical protein
MRKFNILISTFFIYGLLFSFPLTASIKYLEDTPDDLTSLSRRYNHEDIAAYTEILSLEAQEK